MLLDSKQEGERQANGFPNNFILAAWGGEVDRDELGFNAWILVGNVLHALLRGPAASAVSAPTRVKLIELDDALAPVQPSQMLNTLESLPAEDRRLLKRLSEEAFQFVGEDAAALLGMGRPEAQPVLDWLDGAASSTQSIDGDRSVL